MELPLPDANPRQAPTIHFEQYLSSHCLKTEQLEEVTFKRVNLRVQIFSVSTRKIPESTDITILCGSLAHLWLKYKF